MCVQAISEIGSIVELEIWVSVPKENIITIKQQKWDSQLNINNEANQVTMCKFTAMEVPAFLLCFLIFKTLQKQ